SDLNQKGFRATMDLLGEHVDTQEKARSAAQRYHTILETIHQRQIDSTVSLKLTQFGLKVDSDACASMVESVVERAAALNNFVRIDMEDSSCTSATLDVYRRLR